MRHSLPPACNATPVKVTSIRCSCSVGLTIASVSAFPSAVNAAAASKGQVSLPDEIFGLSRPTSPFTSCCGALPVTATGVTPKWRRYNLNINPTGATFMSVRLELSRPVKCVYADIANQPELRNSSCRVSALESAVNMEDGAPGLPGRHSSSAIGMDCIRSEEHTSELQSLRHL